MRVVVQRVSRALVRVDEAVVGEIGNGLCLLVGVADGDGPEDVDVAAEKIVRLRVFPDADGRMNRSVVDVDGGVLVVSQFTLLASLRKGRRPSFTDAADPEIAGPLLDRFVERLESAGLKTACGVFGARMDVELTNHGPVTLVVDVRQGLVV